MSKTTDKAIQDMDVAEAGRILSKHGPAAMYDYMAEFGDKYATLANGVARGDSTAGSAALRHMREIARKNGNPISEEDINKIRQDMAEAYLRVRTDKNAKHDYTQLTAAEAQSFHRRVFKDNGLPEKAWTLEVPFSIYGEEASNKLWNDILDAAGDNTKELIVSMGIVFNMEAARVTAHQLLKANSYPLIGDPEKAKDASEKIDNISEWMKINISKENITKALTGQANTGENIEHPPATDMVTEAATPPQQLAAAFWKDPKKAAQTYPELADAYNALKSVEERFHSPKATEAMHKELSRRIAQGKPIPTPQQARQMIINAVNQGQER